MKRDPQTDGSQVSSLPEQISFQNTNQIESEASKNLFGITVFVD